MSALTVARDGRGVARVTLSRPEVLNAFDEDLIASLTDTFTELSGDPAVRVVVLAADGKLFCSGADIGWMQRQSKNDRDENVTDSRRFARMLQVLHECSKPTVVRVQGSAFGGGVGLMAAADIVISVDAARFAVSEARFGILPSVIGPYLIRAIGARQAQRLAMTTESFDAAAAFRLGLVHEVVTADGLDLAVERTVKDLLKSGPQALVEIKQLYSALDASAVDAGSRDLTALTIARVRATDEARDGFEAFFAKKPAPWVVP